MRALAFAILLVGCRGDESRPHPIEVAPARPPADAETLRGLAPSAHAAIDAPPRDRWPCALEIDEDQGIQAHGRAVFSYGKHTSCRLPASLVAQGIWGCPDFYTRTDTDGMRYERTFTYDHDRIAGFETSISQSFLWDGDRLAKTSRAQWGEADVARYVDRGDAVLAVDAKDQLQELIQLSDGRPVRYAEYLYNRAAATASIVWGDGRPQRVSVDVLGPIRGHVSRVFVYDCSSESGSAKRK